MANVGIAGLNLHVFAYVTDIGFSPWVGATVLSIIASTQLGSTLIWGFLSERMPIRYSSMLMFLIQATGLALAIATSEVAVLYLGFLFYGIGLGGGWVLQEVVWANYFGRLSLGMVRGLGILVTHVFGAAGAPSSVTYTMSQAATTRHSLRLSSAWRSPPCSVWPRARRARS